MSRARDGRRGRTRGDVTVLMTGAGAPGASGILGSLRATTERDVRVVGVDMDPNAYGFALVDEGETVPPATEDDFVPALAAVAGRASADVVLPLTTAELEPLARNREAFEATVMVSREGPLGVANDKGRLYRFLDAEGFASAPRYRRVDDEASFRSAVRDLGYPDRPVCFKPPVESGMRGFRVLDERSDRLSRLLDEKPDPAVTTLDSVGPVLASAETFPELVVMEYLPGPEYSVDVLAMDGAVGAVVPRSRSRTRAGITFEGTVERREDLVAESSAVCRELGLEYNVNLQFRYDGDGNPKVIEINPRVAGTIVMCVAAGANLPYHAVKYALGEEPPPVEVAWGTRMTRYWQEVFRTPDGASFHLGPAAQPERPSSP